LMVSPSSKEPRKAVAPINAELAKLNCEKKK